MSLELTRDLLMDAGGWKEMKAAREMHRAGLVREATYSFATRFIVRSFEPFEILQLIRSSGLLSFEIFIRAFTPRMSFEIS